METTTCHTAVEFKTLKWKNDKENYCEKQTMCEGSSKWISHKGSQWAHCLSYPWEKDVHESLKW